MQKINLGFLLSPIFKEWAEVIIKELENNNKRTSALGFLGGREKYFDSIDKSNFNLGIFYNHNLEKEWLNKSPTVDQIEKYRTLIGDKALKEIIISDRQLGKGYLSGGLVANSDFLRNIKKLGYEAQVNYVINMLSFLDELFVDKKLNVFFAYSVAGALSLACYHICKLHNIKFLRLTVPRIKSLCTIDDSPDDQFNIFGKTYQRRIELEINNDEYYNKARAYLKEYTDSPVQPGYQINQNKVYNRKIKFRYKLKLFLKIPYSIFNRRSNYFHNEPFSNYKLEWSLIKKRRQFWQLINSRSDISNLSFFYFPLHVEPEASTMVLSPWHTDQLTVIESLSKAIPLGEFLIVKEHLTCIGKRPLGFYNRIANLPNVIFITPFYNSLDLIKLSKATITITGTASWEAFLLRKPTLVVGKFLYPFIDKGYKKVENVAYIYNDLSNIGSIQYPSQEEQIQLIAAIFEKSFEWSSKALWHSGGSREVVLKNHKFVKNIVKNIIDNYLQDINNIDD